MLDRIPRPMILSLPSPWNSEAKLKQLLFTSKDAREGLAAYVEERTAKVNAK